MADHCCFCDTRRPMGGTNTLVLGSDWLEFCEPCGNKETLTNGETGEVKTLAEVFDLVREERKEELISPWLSTTCAARAHPDPQVPESQQLTEPISFFCSRSPWLLSIYTICRKKVFDLLFICLQFRFGSVILLVMNIDPKRRMKIWLELSDPKPNWETFKRIGMLGLANWRRNFKKNLDANNK